MEKKAKDIVGKYIKTAFLTHENHIGIWPFADSRPLLSDPRGSLLHLQKGWQLVGWCKAPFKSSREYNDALVLEYDAKAGEDEEYESGIYWIHCKLDKMVFWVKK